MAPHTQQKLSAQPNAGMPRDVGGRSMYMASPEYMATYARHLVQAGAKIVGGCCGTTPEHIHAMVEGIRPLTPRLAGSGRRGEAATARQRRVGDRGRRAPTPNVASSPFRSPSARTGRRSSRAGEFVTSVEIVPPRGVDASRMLARRRRLKAAGVDAVNVPDGPRAQSRMGALLTSVLIEQQVGIETVTHYACRDRNLLGMLSDLLGASAVGLRNLLVITGDPPKMGPYPDATAVFDVDSIGLTNLVSHLNRGLDPGGNAIGTADALRDRRRRESGGDRSRRTSSSASSGRSTRAPSSRSRSRCSTPRSSSASSRRDRARAHPDHRRHLAARVRAQRRVSGERGARRIGSRRHHRAHAAREREVEGARRRRGHRDRARDARPNPAAVQGVQVSAPFGKVELALEVFSADGASADG